MNPCGGGIRIAGVPRFKGFRELADACFRFADGIAPEGGSFGGVGLNALNKTMNGGVTLRPGGLFAELGRSGDRVGAGPFMQEGFGGGVIFERVAFGEIAQPCGGAGGVVAGE